MAGEIVGRQAELERLHGLLGSTELAMPRAIVLEGEAGIGKSTLWRTAVDAARAGALRVLAARPAEAERGLAFAGLGDLLEPALQDVLPELPPPRRRALEVALLVEESPAAVDPRALGVAVRSALEVLATDQPPLVAIDDVQWLDRSSESALAFAFRRLESAARVLLARRVAEGIVPSELEVALGPDRVERVRVGPLSVGAIQTLLRERLDRVFPRPTLLRIHDMAGGNPFYALEIGRALSPELDPTHPLPVPETLEGLLSARLGGLPHETREALILASALGSPSLKLLRAAGVGEDALEPAVAARVVEHEDGTVRFTHPLLASVLYLGLSPGERRRAHRFLAGVVVDGLERARHLALSTEGPDPEIAAALEEAAAAAARRGAMVAAAELGEHALRLTPVTAVDDEHRRAIAVGQAHLAAGQVDRARMLGQALLDKNQNGAARAETLVFLSELESGPLQDRIALRRDALRDESVPAELRLRIHQRLALEVRFFDGRSAAERHARAALELAEEVDDASLKSGALAALAMLEFQAGDPDALGRAQKAYELAIDTGDAGEQAWAGFCLAHVLVWSFDLRGARRQLESIDREWSARDERVSAQAHWYLSLIELWAGRLDRASECAERAREIGVLYGRGETEDPQNLFPIALVHAHRGELESAREAAEVGLRLAEAFGALLPGFPAVLGLVASWGGGAAEAVRCFERAEDAARRVEWLEPGLVWWRADYVESLLELERTARAVGLLEEWEAMAASLGREWVLAQAMRCRGLVAAADGEIDDGLALLEEAARRHAVAGDPFGRARAHLALGRVLRRARQKRAARAAGEQALAAFEELGAHGWAERARAELGSIGGRRRAVGLTPAERRVAALVAEGRTNREVAAALFLGERTVETHLSHIYAKLGVRSRTELARVYVASS